ncbi:MAG: cupin domain-containing protein [Gammaproteobacteria bacterium]
MPAPLGGMDPGHFLERYWQREPCLLRGAMAGFDPLLDGDDLAGLACDPLAESRLVEGPDAEGSWRVRHGPFEDADFTELGTEGWTLLVQDVEKHFPPLAALLDQFAFLPRWRLDDLMVSFAATGGSVGPHVDQYDVFLLQARGRRHWQVAREFDPELVPDLPLAVLRNFEAEQGWEVEPGDMLYLPPGVAHHGVALEPCMTFSIGLRAPSAADLHLALGEWLAATPGEGGRYADPALQVPERPGEVDAGALRRLQRLLGSSPEISRHEADFLTSFLSRFRLAHEPAAPVQPPEEGPLLTRLEAGMPLERHPWTRLCWHEWNGEARLFAAGTAYRCSPRLATLVCGPVPVALSPSSLAPQDRETLLALVRDGHLLAMDDI